MYLLKEVVGHVFSGYSFRSKVEPSEGGDLAIIQMKDIVNDYSAIADSLTYVDKTLVAAKYYLQSGDVLFISKGANNFAVEFDRPNQATVAASAFFVIRPDKSKILPGYLTWYINQKPVQDYLKENRSGTYIPNVNKKIVEEIPIAIPDLSKQKLISQIATLSLREEDLLNQLRDTRHFLVNTILTESLIT